MGRDRLEWQTPSPPPTDNFDETPVVTEEPYDYPPEEPRPTITPRLRPSAAATTYDHDRSTPHGTATARPSPHQFEDLGQQHDGATLGMWTFLATEVMFFGGLFAGYAVYRSPAPTPSPRPAGAQRLARRRSTPSSC